MLTFNICEHRSATWYQKEKLIFAFRSYYTNLPTYLLVICRLIQAGRLGHLHRRPGVTFQRTVPRPATVCAAAAGWWRDHRCHAP